MSNVTKAKPTYDELLARVAQLEQQQAHAETRGLCVSAHDITEHKRAEEEHARMFDLTPALLCVARADGFFAKINREWSRVLGYSTEEILALGYAGLIHPDDIEPTSAEVARQLAGQSTIAFVNRYRCKDGSYRTLEWQATPAMDGLLYACARDVTENLRTKELEAQLQQAQKMESVGRLAGGVAHDFNNMLSVILANTDAALEQVDPAQPLHEDLAEIRAAASRSADLTRQLLAFARRQTIAPKVLDLNGTVAGMLSILHRLVGENIQLFWQPKAGLWPVRMDPGQVDLILANLCVNARDAIADVGSITIATGTSAFDAEDFAEPPGMEPGEYVVLTVRDDGCGMDQATRAHVFEPFFTTKGVGKGTGLGLATVYGIVKQNSGFVDVRSEPGKGTTFTIYLPRHLDKASQLQVGGAALPAERGHETVLVVEDETPFLRATRRMLERHGYNVLTASTPGEAMQLAREHAGEIHVLVTDVIMPEMNGRELAKLLQAVYPHVKRLFMSGYTADVIAHHGVLEEGVAFIEKPFSRDELAAKVREVLDAEDGA